MLAVLALSVFSTALAFVIYFRLCRRSDRCGTTAQAYVRVPIGVAIGVLFLGERLIRTAWIGLSASWPALIAMTIPARKGWRR